MANPPSSGAGGGTNIESLHLGLDTTQIEKGTTVLDTFGTATVVSVRKVNDLNEALKSNKDWNEQVAKSYQNRIQQMEAEWAKEQKAAKDIARAEEDVARAKEAMTLAGQRYLDTLQQMNASVGKTTAELQRMRAAELGVADAAESTIVAIEKQTVGLRALEYSAYRTMEAQEALYLKTTAAAEYAALRTMEANEAVYLKNVAARTADEASLATHIEREIAMGSAKTKAAEYSALREMEVAEALYLKRAAAAEYSALKEMEANEAVYLKRQTQMKIDEVALATHIEREIALSKAKTEAAEYNALREMEVNEALQLKRAAAAEYAALAEMQANESAYLRRMELRKLDELAMEAHLQKELAANAAALKSAEYRAMREMEAAEAVYLRKAALLEKQRVDAERAALADIRYGQLSTKQKIAELDKLKAYMANSAIRPETINSTFSKAAQDDLKNYTSLVSKLAQETEKHGHSYKKANGEAKTFSEMMKEMSFNTSRARAEFIVLGHELYQGRLTRMPGSMMVLAEYTNMSALLFSKLGIGILGAAAAAGIFAVQIGKGILQQHDLNTALNRTNMASGATISTLTNMAESAGSVHGNMSAAYDATTKLAASGMYTAEQIGQITKAATEVEHAFRVDVNTTIQEFEALVVKGSKVGAVATYGVTRAVQLLDEKYHFLNTTQMQSIVQLEAEGKQREASALAIKLFSDEHVNAAKRSVQYTGYIQTAWHNVGNAIDSAMQKIRDFGATDTLAQKLKAVNDKIRNTYDRPSGFSGAGDNERKRLEGERDAIIKQIDAERVASEKVAAQKRKEAEANRELATMKIEDVRLMRKSEDELNRALDEHRKRVQSIDEALPGWSKMVDPSKGINNPKYLADREAAIIREHTRRSGGKGPKDDPDLTNLRTKLDAFDNLYQAAKEVATERERELADLRRDGVVTNEEYFKKMRKAQSDETAAAKIAHDDKLAVLRSYTTKSEVEKAKVVRMIQDVNAAYEKVKAANSARTKDLDRDEKGVERARVKEIMGDVSKDGEKELADLDRKIAAQQKYNDEVGKTAEQKQLAAAAREAETLAQNEADAAFLQNLLATQTFDEATTDIFTARMVYLQRQVDKQRELNGLQAIGAKKDGVEADYKAADKLAKTWQEAGNTIGKSLEQAFGKGGKAMGEMFKAYARGNATQIELERDLRKSQKANEGLKDEGFRNKKAQDKFDADSARNRMSEYGNMAGAAAGFFDEQSNGYKALMVMSQVFHAAELAMTMAELVPKATAAILNQGNGDPYSAFARMAAMAAIVAGLGVAVAGGGGKKVDVAKERQEAQGAGSVLGDVKAKSESIARSLDMIENATYQDIQIAKGMLNSLLAIQNSIGNFAALVVRGGEVNGANSANVDYQRFGGGSVKRASAMTGAAAGAYIGSSFGPIGTAAGFVIGGLLGAVAPKFAANVFGGSQSLKDAGFGMSKQTVGNIAQQGANGWSYTDVETDGGWFHSDKTKRQWETLGPDANKQFTMVVGSMADTIVSAGVLLGESEALMQAKVDSFTVDVNNISLKGKTGEEIEKIMGEVFSKMGDDMAKHVLPMVEQFQKVGEGQLETLTRLAVEYQTVELVFRSMGKTFGQVGIGSMAARERLIELSGGLDQFVSQASTYLDAFYTEQEKADFLRREIDPTLAKYGLTTSGPNADKMFRDFIESLDTTTQYGAETYAALMGTVPAFEAILNVTRQIADERKSLEDELAELVLTPEQLLTRQRDELDASNRALFDQIQAIKKQKEATDASKESMTQAIDKFKQFSDSMRTMRDGLLVGNLSTLTPEKQYEEARRQFENIVQKARGGDEAAQGQISTAANTFLEASRVVNASDTKYTSDFVKVLRVTEEMERWATTQASFEQQSLDALTAQIEGIAQLNNTLNNVLWAIGDIRMPQPVSAGISSGSFEGYYFRENGTDLPLNLVEEMRTNTANIISSNARVTQEAAKTTVGGIMESSKVSSYTQRVLTMEME